MSFYKYHVICFLQVTGMHMEQDHAQDNSWLHETNISAGVPVQTRTQENAPQTFHPYDLSSTIVHPVPVTFQANPAFYLNTDAAPVSLNLSLSFNLNEPSNSRRSAFTMMPSFSDGDSNSNTIRVA